MYVFSVRLVDKTSLKRKHRNNRTKIIIEWKTTHTLFTWFRPRLRLVKSLLSRKVLYNKLDYNYKYLYKFNLNERK